MPFVDLASFPFTNLQGARPLLPLVLLHPWRSVDISILLSHVPPLAAAAAAAAATHHVLGCLFYSAHTTLDSTVAWLLPLLLPQPQPLLCCCTARYLRPSVNVSLLPIRCVAAVSTVSLSPSLSLSLPHPSTLSLAYIYDSFLATSYLYKSVLLF